MRGAKRLFIVAFLLVFATLVSSTSDFSCKEFETLPEEGLTSPHLTRQNAFNDNFLFYQRGSRMYAKRLNGFYFSTSPELDFGEGEIVSTSTNFQGWGAVYFRAPNGNILATFFDSYGTIQQSSTPVLLATEANMSLPMFSDFSAVSMGHLFFASQIRDGNASFAMKRTGDKFQLLAEFQPVQLASNVSNEGVIQAYTVDETGQLFLVIANPKNQVVHSLTLDLNQQETPFENTLIQPGKPIPVAANHTVQSVGSSGAGEFMVVTSLTTREEGTKLHTLLTKNYGRTWTMSFVVLEMLNTANKQFVTIQWVENHWVVVLDMAGGKRVLVMSSKQPFAFEWVEALGKSVNMFRSEDRFAFLPPRPLSSSRAFTLLGQTRNFTRNEITNHLTKYSCTLASQKSMAASMMGFSPALGLGLLVLVVSGILN